MPWKECHVVDERLRFGCPPNEGGREDVEARRVVDCDPGNAAYSVELVNLAVARDQDHSNKMPGPTARENGKKGGRPKGAKAKKTLEKEIARARLRELVHQEFDKLIEAQIRTALGVRHFVLREPDGKFKRVTTPATITRILNAPPGKYEFHDIWVRDPNTAAFKDLMDRAFDKPSEHIALTVPDDAERIRP